jgi:hypothetical protein
MTPSEDRLKTWKEPECGSKDASGSPLSATSIPKLEPAKREPTQIQHHRLLLTETTSLWQREIYAAKLEYFAAGLQNVLMEGDVCATFRGEI